MRCSALRLIVALCLFGLGAVEAQADTVGLDFSTVYINTSLDLSLGYEFRVNAPIGVTYLGIYDYNHDGLQGAHDVGLWTSTGTPLATTTISAGTADPLVGYFRWHRLDSMVLLDPGQQYVVGAIHVTSLPSDYYTRDTGGTVIAPEITYITARWQTATSLVYPAQTNATFGYFGGNIRFVTIPEPAGLGLLGLLALGLSRRGMLDLRKRRHD